MKPNVKEDFAIKQIEQCKLTGKRFLIFGIWKVMSYSDFKGVSEPQKIVWMYVVPKTGGEIIHYFYDSPEN